jgi:HD-GYP domain-containing protein (c-di-GMP phosphodiesterase class II)
MQTHPIIGAQILAPIKFLQRAVPIVECHHEQWDGNGYPRGLKAEEIPLPARIFFVVDTFDAMTSDRPYRRALSVERALDEILTMAGRQFDPDIAREFAALCSERTGTWPLERDLRADH